MVCKTIQLFSRAASSLSHDIVQGTTFILKSKVAKIAIPLVIATALYGAKGADSGPITYAGCYAACMATCAAATMGGFLPACAVACAQYCIAGGIAPTP